MRRFFSFRSSASSCGSSNPTPPAPQSSNNEKLFREKLQESDVNLLSEQVQGGSLTHKNSVCETLNWQPASKNSCHSHHRRSLSFSSAAVQSGEGEGNIHYTSELSRLPSCRGDSPHPVAECHMHYHPPVLERCIRCNRGDQAAPRPSHAVGNLGSPTSSRDYRCSAEDSPHISPAPFRCRAACLRQILDRNKYLDRYMSGEHRDVKPKKDPQKQFSDSVNDCLSDNGAFRSSGRLSQAQATAPSSPIHCRENLRAYSFREEKGSHCFLLAPDWTQDDLRSTSPLRYTKLSIENPSHALAGKSWVKSRDYDSETTTTVEDIYEDSSQPEPTLNSNDVAQDCSTNLAPPYESVNGFCIEELLDLQRQSCFLGDRLTGTKSDKFLNSRLLERHADEELRKKLKDIEQMTMVLSEEDLELEEFQKSNLNISELFETIRNIAEDRKYLTLELSSQIQCRLTERSDAKEGIQKAKLDMDNRIRRLEKEKNELQSSLEKELDRRSGDWSIKLEKFQSEEQRLRERVRELAEQNVSLQRKISSLKGVEMDTQSRIMNSERQLNDLKTNLEQVRTENQNLQQSLSELQERLNGAEEDRDSIKRSYVEQTVENKDLQKAVVRLQRMCSEQNKTINGLRQEYNDEIGRQSLKNEDHVSRLQMEQLRLTGVEYNLRKEVESCRHELEYLRHENISLLNRWQAMGSGYGISYLKLDQELCARVDFLQTQGLSLLEGISHFSGELLGFIKCKKYECSQEASNDCDGYAVVDYNVKYQSLRRGCENFERSLQSIASILAEKSTSQALESQTQTTEGGGSKKLKDELEHELKAESVLNRVLREKLCTKELEIEQLQADLASSIWVHDVLQTEIQRQQDDLSCLTHKIKDTELQMLKKDESINQLRHDLQECTKELAATRNILMKVTKERDNLWEEVKHSRETIMLLNHEVLSLRKRIEDLDEDVLTKEGQIAILKDSLGDKPFDIIGSPKSVKEFSLE